MVHPRSAPQLLGGYPRYKHLYPNNLAGSCENWLNGKADACKNGPCKDLCLGEIQGGQQCWSQCGSSEPCTSFSFIHIKLYSPGKALLAPQMPLLSLVEALATFRETLHQKFKCIPHLQWSCLMQPSLEVALGWLGASLTGWMRVGPVPPHPPAWQCWTQ